MILRWVEIDGNRIVAEAEKEWEGPVSEDEMWALLVEAARAKGRRLVRVQERVRLDHVELVGDQVRARPGRKQVKLA